jgi:hypothetical protein
VSVISFFSLLFSFEIYGKKTKQNLQDFSGFVNMSVQNYAGWCGNIKKPKSTPQPKRRMLFGGGAHENLR